ncbi:uncharacterized protein LOC124938326 [Impatiens glandulifera]|uniref:uncharacterized protein LOC124938326 n=1 Tax=Impatiens glandulifera TaxID=253017 RepID=UPI001FB09F65|nr:uncharacterized protein LOC124938326 [Impatiens glandulifera]
MDPCSFVRIVVRNLFLKFPSSTTTTIISSSFFCKIKFNGFPSQIVSLPLDDCSPSAAAAAACFTLTRPQFDNLFSNSSKSCCLKVEVFSSSRRGLFCSRKLLGSVSIPLDLKGNDNSMSRTTVIHNGCASINGSKTLLNLRVQADPDPRFVFQFEGQPECSPQIFQINDKIRQPVFTCKFALRNAADRDLKSRSISETTTKSKRRNWLRLNSLRNQDRKNRRKEQRKGWTITIHDLSGSPVAAASMVTPFVPSPGSDRVNKSNPGAWLILLPGDGTWKPWGRLEAWRESGDDRIGYRFELLPDPTMTSISEPVILHQSTISTKSGGKFAIDICSGASPASTPGSSCDFGSGYGSGSESGSWLQFLYNGFVMSSTVKGEGKRSAAVPRVEVGVRHVTCTEDAAGFVALAAALNLTVDTCRPFSKKLRKELTRRGNRDHIV